jgi:plasmid replication initiation protein
MVQIKDTTSEKGLKVAISREQNVVKANDLIQKSRFNLTTQEQKLILYLVSKIKPTDEEFKYHDIEITDFCDVCGIHRESGMNYRKIKDSIKTLADKSLWIKIKKGEYEEHETLLRWINKARLYQKRGIIKIQLDEDMKPFLLQLKDKFTQYDLIYTLAMRSQYSIRLYELLKSYEWEQKPKTFVIDELKRLLSAENYTRFPDFKRKVLDIAMREINAVSDLESSYQVIKVGRKYGAIEFTMKIRKDITQRFQIWNNIDKIINPNVQIQLSLFDDDANNKF